VKPWCYSAREYDDTEPDRLDYGTRPDDDERWPGSWAGLALCVGWCLLGLIVYYCFADATPRIQAAELSLLEGVLVALLSGSLTAVTYFYWMHHQE
jgi:hypothetical protein